MNAPTRCCPVRIVVVIGLALVMSVPAGASPSTETWTEASVDYGRADEVAAGEGGIFVASTTYPLGRDDTDVGLSALAASDGTELWSVGMGEVDVDDACPAVAVSHDGSSVFFAFGDSWLTEPTHVAAFDAATGTVLWERQLDGSLSCGEAMAVSPDGLSLYLVGSFEDDQRAREIWIASLDTVDGTPDWEREWGVAGQDTPSGIVVSAAGSRIAVVGVSSGADGRRRWRVLLFDSAGVLRWHKARFASARGAALKDGVFSPDGHSLLVTGSRATCRHPACEEVAATASLRTGDGHVRWHVAYDERRGQEDGAREMALLGVSGRVVVVSGFSAISYHVAEATTATVAYRTRDGARLWVRKGPDVPYNTTSSASLAAEPGGHTAYVTTTYGYPLENGIWTVAYSRSGDKVWEVRYEATGGGWGAGAEAGDVAVGPDGGALYVVGQERPSASETTGHALTLAYET